MIVVYAEKEDMGIRYAAALGGISFNGNLINTANLTDHMNDVKKNLADKQGYIETSYKGKKYVITWGWGHFGTLKDIKDYNPEYDKWYKIPLPFIPKKYESKRIQNPNEYFRKRDDRQFALVTKIFNSDKCEYIINATDWEREGELIFAYVYDLTGTKKPYYRLRNTAKTEKEIRKAFENLVDSRTNYPYVLAARARSIADWSIGINMTIASTLYLSKDKSLLNVGRVMTPTLNLIVEREKEILNFVEETNYGIKGIFTTQNGDIYEGKLEEDLFKTEEQAKALISSIQSNGIIVSAEKKKETKKPPLLHNTNTLQIEANEVYGYTLEQTLNIAQKLYESGYITYPRVDSQYLTEDKKNEMPSLISLLGKTNRYKEFVATGAGYMPNRYFNNAKIDGHDAIIITDMLPKSLSQEQMNVYDLIARRLLMSIQEDAINEKTTIITSAGEYTFKTTGTRCINEGWQALLLNKKAGTNSELPNLTESEAVTGSYETYKQTSKPPQRYTDATLIKAMENCGRKMEDEEAKEYLKKSKGIGRPATRAALIEKLINSNYVERHKKQIVPTDKGISAIDAITIDSIKSPILTAEWEKALDEIELSGPAECVKKLQSFISSINTTAADWCTEVKEHKVQQIGGKGTGIYCPDCGSELVDGKDSYFCSRYKDGCKFNIRKVMSGKKISLATAKTILDQGATKPMKGFKSKAGKEFSAKLVLDKACRCLSCDTIQSPGEKCYKCGGMLERIDQSLVRLEFDNSEKGGKNGKN